MPISPRRVGVGCVPNFLKQSENAAKLEFVSDTIRRPRDLGVRPGECCVC